MIKKAFKFLNNNDFTKFIEKQNILEQIERNNLDQEKLLQLNKKINER